MPEKDLQQLSINTIRFLSIDAVQKANSGHPGMPMGCAPIAYRLYTKYMKHNPAESQLVKPRQIYSLCRSRKYAFVFNSSSLRIQNING